MRCLIAPGRITTEATVPALPLNDMVALTDAVTAAMRAQLDPKQCCRCAIAGFALPLEDGKSPLEDDDGIQIIRDLDALAGVFSKSPRD